MVGWSDTLINGYHTGAVSTANYSSTRVSGRDRPGARLGCLVPPMSTEMTASDDNGDNMTRTTIKVDDQVWRRVRSEAIREDKKVSEQLEAILREYFERKDAE